MSSVVINGTVKSVKKNEFVILSDGTTYNMIYNDFLPIKMNDMIKAICKKHGGKYMISEPPLVSVPTSFNTLKSNIKYWCSSSAFIAEQILKDIDHNMLCSLSEAHKTDISVVKVVSEQTKLSLELSSKLLYMWHKEYNLRPLYLLGLTNKDIKYSYKACQDLYRQLLVNPYVIYNLSMEKCRSICKRLNIVLSETEGILVRQVYSNVVNNHWICTPKHLLTKGREIDFDNMGDYPIVVDYDVYLKRNYNIEVGVVAYVKSKLKHNFSYLTWHYINHISLDSDSNTIIKQYWSQLVNYKKPVVTDINLSNDQVLALSGALNNSICIITGSAGSGKSSVVGQLIKNVDSYLLTSFTGKAVSKLQEVTGNYKVCTMHRLIKENRKEAYEYLIIDEISMVTTELFYKLVKCYTFEKIVLVGDINQLQPIDAGNLLQELSQCVPIFRLTTNHRNVDGIFKVANRILLRLPMVINNNFNLIEGGMQDLFDVINGFWQAKISIDDFVVITPYNDYINVINRYVQSLYNNKKGWVDNKGIHWIVGDKVMLLRNFRTQKIYNGITGYVTAATKDGVMIDFDQFGIHEFKSQYVEGDEEDSEGEDYQLTLDKLKHGYCCTVDKSQGGEYTHVIGFIGHFTPFINMNRIYTLVTRAKQSCWLVTPSIYDLNSCLKRSSPVRYENLANRLKS